MIHITPLTGDTHTSHAPPPDDPATEAMMPIAREGRGTILISPRLTVRVRGGTGPTWTFDLHAEMPRAGARATKLVVCGVCAPEDAAELWDVMREGQVAILASPTSRARQVSAQDLPWPGRMPQSRPWLAVAIAPGLVDMSRGLVETLASIEQTMAWALLLHRQEVTTR